ncbi:hypothetical protein Tco_0322386 [Tanacetum coccineum]
MAPKRATRSNTAPETTNTTYVTNAQLHDADRNTNDNDSHNSGTSVRRTERTARECTYTDFLKCQPLNIKGMEGVAGLTQWFKRMESVFHISNYTVENQVKFSTCTLHSVALTWWNTHVKTADHDAAYRSGEKKPYGGSKPLCANCNYHHDGPCAPKCHKCNRVGDLARDCRSTANANTVNNQRGTGVGQKPTCYEYGAQGHFRGNV